MAKLSLSKPSRIKGKLKVYIHSFISALDAGEWSTSHSGCRTPDTQMFKKQIFLTLPEIDLCLISYKKFIKHP
jgi:hypothetical protein